MPDSHKQASLSRWIGSLTVIAIVGGWQVFASLDLLAAYVSSPHQIIKAFDHWVTSGGFLTASTNTISRVVVGFMIGSGLGALLGLLAGTFARLGSFLSGITAVAYPMPKIAMFPVLVVILGFTETSRVTLIAIVCFFPVYLNSYSGARAVAEEHQWVGRNVEASGLRSFRQIVLPSALPRMLVGLRISAALSFTMVFAVEALALTPGIGSTIFSSYQAGLFAPMYAGIITLSLFGYIADRALVAMGTRLMRGQVLELWDGGEK